MRTEQRALYETPNNRMIESRDAFCHPVFLYISKHIPECGK